MHDKIVELVRTCLDADVPLPAADEDLMPLIDRDELEEETFAEGLTEIADEIGIDPAAMFPDESSMVSAQRVARLQALAPFWPRAATALEAVENRAERVTINGLVASAQAGQWQSVGGTSIRYAPMDRQLAIRRASVALVFPGGMAAAIGGFEYLSCENVCRPCPQTYAEAFNDVLPFAYAIGLVFAITVGACAVWTVLRLSSGRLSRDPA